MNELPLGLMFTILAILILLSAFFSSAETGMLSLNRYRLKHMRKQGHRGARRASRLLKRPDRLISLILIGNNLVNFVTASLFTVVAIRLWGDAAAIILAPVILTLVILIFAEITPKTLAALYPEKIAFPASAVLTPLLKILSPLVSAINIITNNLLKLFGVDPTKQRGDQLSADELRTIVGDAGPHIPQRHQGMLLNILDLEQASVEDIMIPRNEIIGLDIEEDSDTLLQRIRSLEVTRIPVYENDINNIVGILHQRTVSRIINEQGIFEKEKFRKEIHEPYFIPETTPLHTQLFNFQKQQRRMGIVVDEYGVVKGIVTLDDILEEIVGEFTSNLSDQTKDVYTLADGTIVIDGTATIREINKTLGWSLPNDGPKTLNGLLLEKLESFPDGPVCTQVNNYDFEINEVVENKIKSVKAFARATTED